jgi:SMC interacting uncharacterized protein involved in chromosome segregation
MCVVSMVHDHYRQEFERLPLWTTFITGVNQDHVIALKDAEITALKKQVEDYRVALEAAKTVDALTKQPDCADPEKAKLQRQVEILNARLDELRRSCGMPPRPVSP